MFIFAVQNPDMSAKIAFLCGSKSWGGLEMNHLQHALWMKENGHDVLILCRENSAFAEKSRLHGLRILFLPEYRRYKYFFAGLTLKSLLKKESISHLQVRNANDLNVCAIAKRFSKQKFQLSYYMEMQLGVSKRNFLHTVRFKQIDYWICPLPYLRQQVLNLTRFPENRIRVIPSALNLKNVVGSVNQLQAREQLGVPKQSIVLGLIGRIDVLKGQLLLVEALHLLNDPELAVCIMGAPTANESNFYWENLQEKIRDYKLENQVCILPFRDDVGIFYQAMDAIVMASKSETFGMVSIEALANGKPVIGSNSGGTPEILGHGLFGLLFESMNAQDLAEKIAVFKENPRNFEPEKLKVEAQRYDHERIYSLILSEILHL